ncbi:hypothetical protein BpHYR1_044843 [Brachionus plicatilis]|uniref:Uncharacterized protein n=1 Tax=Brachionus plicatilis TaxID=10195 RepID=A0A3M7RAU4_BRAPC|nr:hypothetical protein BpHYR1_044843 [Brachionus plicatilis]
MGYFPKIKPKFNFYSGKKIVFAFIKKLKIKKLWTHSILNVTVQIKTNLYAFFSSTLPFIYFSFPQLFLYSTLRKGKEKLRKGKVGKGKAEERKG